VHDRQELLAGFSRAMLQTGAESLRYQDVSEVTGVPVASLRHYFPTIKELRRAALRHLVDTELTNLRTAVSRIVDPWERIVAIAQHSETAESLGRQSEWVIWLEYFRTVTFEPELREEYHEVVGRYLELIRETIAAGIEDGTLDPVVELDDAVALTLALIDGNGFRLAIEDAPEDAREATRRTVLALRLLLGVAADRV